MPVDRIWHGGLTWQALCIYNFVDYVYAMDTGAVLTLIAVHFSCQSVHTSTAITNKLINKHESSQQKTSPRKDPQRSSANRQRVCGRRRKESRYWTRGCGSKEPIPSLRLLSSGGVRRIIQSELQALYHNFRVTISFWTAMDVFCVLKRKKGLKHTVRLMWINNKSSFTIFTCGVSWKNRFS